MNTPVSPLAALAFLFGGGVAGFVAAVAMDVPMNRQPEGWTPAWLAAATVRRTSPDAIPFRDASAAHHGAGVLAGAGYGLLTFLLGLAAPWPAFAGVSVVGHLVAVVVVTLFIYGFFAHFVLPRVGGQVYEERATAVRGQWLRSALTFAAVMTVAGPLLLVLFGAAFGFR
jgi:hypothetical protein